MGLGCRWILRNPSSRAGHIGPYKAMLEHGYSMIYAGLPSSLGFGVGFNFLASSVPVPARYPNTTKGLYLKQQRVRGPLLSGYFEGSGKQQAEARSHPQGAIGTHMCYRELKGPRAVHV